MCLGIGMLLRRILGIGTLRRTWRTAPLVLVGLAVFLIYHTSVVNRTGFRPGQEDQKNKSVMRDRTVLLKHPEELVSLLEAWHDHNEVHWSERSCAGKAIMLTGQHVPSDTEVQLYHRVLQEQGYHVSQGRYAETSATLTHSSGDGQEWSLLICLKGTEKSCLRKINFAHSQPYQRVNIIPAFVGAFMDMGGVCRFLTDSRFSGMSLPIIPSACTSSRPELGRTPHHTEHIWTQAIQSGSLANQGLVALVNVYVLVASATPLTAFLHRTGLVRTHLDKHSYITQLQSFFADRLDPTAALQASELMKQVISEVLTAAVLTTADSSSPPRCSLCFQLMTFTLHYNASVRPVAVKVQTDLHFDGIKDPDFDGQITKEYILEDMLKLLFPACSSEDRSPQSIQDTAEIKYSGCEQTNSLCLTPHKMQFLLQFHQQLKRSGSFHLLYPRSSPFSNLRHDVFQRFPTAEDSGRAPGLSALLQQLSSSYTQSDDPDRPEKWDSQPPESGRCVQPHLRQLYTDPPLVLTPLFNPWVKEYRAEVPFDVVTIRIRPEPVSAKCHVHLDEHCGPRTANYPLGLGNSRISILLMDESGEEPVVMTIYTLHIFRESRPSLPMFDEYVMCGFIQDCGLVVRPDQPCGLEPVSELKSSQPCSSGDEPGHWVVPCLSCSDNRTCDWREVAWQPDSCYYPVLEQPQLQRCMMDKKVLFIGDSTNRGMMYYLMERVNTTLEDWDKAHDTIIYHNLNQGRTLISYSYYPQFWLHKNQRPTFQQALEQLIERSRPLENSPQTVLVAGGVQWLSLEHLRTMQQVLEREKLQNIMVVVKSLGMGFHLPVDGIHSLSLNGVQDLFGVNKNILESAKRLRYEVIDTFSITMGRYKEFLQGRCACHFHEVGKPSLPTVPAHKRLQIVSHAGESVSVTSTRPEPSSRPSSSYHVKGAVNQVYSEILLSRVCMPYIHNGTSSQR
ncbi:cadherin-like and PC-esterase domain-containing protein 1 isoform X2 [Pangasianodon hypophthalmus]|uniref:cadherin-like and PC-esterase domain-containing protein 1 isoform X2 n=1 Tax=Pangasianodon hypophthalmus TaxID=310915 RepID=UPI002306EE39|nr:cadherin-like and PC-esterase domain-containing protein 1 isoform X2 [Pangasianodon hypophthalmus]